MSARLTNNQLRRLGEKKALPSMSASANPNNNVQLEYPSSKVLNGTQHNRTSLKHRIMSKFESAKRSLKNKMKSDPGIPVSRSVFYTDNAPNTTNTPATTTNTFYLPNVPTHPVVPLTLEEQQKRFLESPAQFPSTLRARQNVNDLHIRRTAATTAEGNLRAQQEKLAIAAARAAKATSSASIKKKGGSRKNKTKKQKNKKNLKK